MKKINFQITGECNLKCAFCSDAVSYQNFSNQEEVKEMMDHLIEVGLEEIHITGGEPLLYPGIKEILRYLKEKNVQISLSTNGLLLAKMKDILPFLDEIILPIDASSSKTLEKMGRNANQIFATAENIQMIREENINTKITISTTLNHQNMNELKNIEMIISMMPIEKWQIHQFLPHGRGKRNIQKFILDDRLFEQAVAYLKTTSFAEKIEPISVSEKIDSDWVISPNLKLMKLDDEKPIFYGKISEMSNIDLKSLLQDKTKVLKQ